MKRFRRLMKKFETAMNAAAFAEAGDFQTARQILREGERVDGRETKRPEMRKQPLRKICHS